jgi:alkaline phosphatase D
MIFEDERAAPTEQLGFIHHLGDFIYEVVEYPDEVKTRYDRIIYDVGRIPDGGKVSNFHYPLTLEGYRVVYKGYLADPDLQDARARWPFVCMWDNHEFSWQGWQSIQQAGGPPRPGQSIKVEMTILHAHAYAESVQGQGAVLGNLPDRGRVQYRLCSGHRSQPSCG